MYHSMHNTFAISFHRGSPCASINGVLPEKQSNRKKNRKKALVLIILVIVFNHSNVHARLNETPKVTRACVFDDRSWKLHHECNQHVQYRVHVPLLSWPSTTSGCLACKFKYKYLTMSNDPLNTGEKKREEEHCSVNSYIGQAIAENKNWSKM